MAEVELDIIVDVQNSLKSIEKFQRDSVKSLQGVESAFTALGAVAAGALAFFSGRALVSAIADVTEAASIQEDAINQLNTSLKLAGDFSEEASESMQEFASQLQATTIIGDETTLSQLALAKSFGASNEQAQDLVAAAADLSAATGISLDSAVRNLGKTFGGLTGELGEVVPTLKNLSKEALESGAAIDFILERFGGAAAAQVQTFSGAITQLQNLVGDLREEFGFLITQNPLVIAAINGLSEGFGKIIESVSENRDQIISLVNTGLKVIINFIPSVIGSFKLLIDVVNGVQLGLSNIVIGVGLMARAFKEIDFIKNLINGISNGFKILTVTVTNSISQLVDLVSNIPGISIAFKALNVDLDAISKSFKDIAEENALAVDLTIADEALDSLDKLGEQALETSGNIDRTLSGLGQGIDFVKNIAEEAIKGLDDLGKAAKESKANIDQVNEGLEFTFKSLKDLVAVATPKIKIALETSLRVAAESFAGAALAGAEGAKKLVSSVGAAAAEAIVPGAGKIAGPILDAFAEGPDSVKAQVEAFADALPKVIVNIFESLPVFIDALIEAIPQIVEEIAAQSDKIVIGLARGLAKASIPLSIAIARDVPIALVRGIAEAITGVELEFKPEKLQQILQETVQNFAGGLAFAFINIAEALSPVRDIFLDIVNFFDSLSTDLDNLFGNVGSKFVEEVSKFIDFLGQAIRGMVLGLAGIFRDVFGGINTVIDDFTSQLDEALNGFPSKALGGLTQALSTLGDQVVGAILTAFDEVGDRIARRLGLDGGGDTPGELGGVELPSATDIVLAPVTSGASVIPGAPSLGLTGGDSGGQSEESNQVIISLLGQISAQLRRPLTTDTTIEVDGDQLANVILNLDRRNQRLTA